MNAWALAITLLTLTHGDIDLKLESESRDLDYSRSTFVTMTISSPQVSPVALPQIGSRLKGFKLLDHYEEKSEKLENGKSIRTLHYQLMPISGEEEFKIKPFVIGETYTKAIYFNPPKAPEEVTGKIEVKLEKDREPLSWKLVGKILLMILATLVILGALFFTLRFLSRKIKEIKMNPIERAREELKRLEARSLPKRGKFKDFYVELTRIVRRYIQRKYSIRATNMTTEEFLQSVKSPELESFLVSADMIKFAGVEATLAMSDSATADAKEFLNRDNAKTGGLK